MIAASAPAAPATRELVTVASHVEPALRPYLDAGVFSAAEAHTTATLARLAGETDPLVHLGIALACWAPLHGHVCVDLAMLDTVIPTAVANARAIADVPGTEPTAADAGGDAAAAPVWPPLRPWLAALRASPLVRTVEEHDPTPVLDGHPLVLHGPRLALQRQWSDECGVAAALRARVGHHEPVGPAAAAVLDALLPGGSADGEREVDGAQRRAGELVISSRLAVIVGGPGTGKTYTVARALAAAIADAHAQGRAMRVALCAPTGKAAQRMTEAIAGALAHAAIPAPLAAEPVDLRATTIHRLLGHRPGRRTRFAHDAQSPLAHDVVVVDEASMVALPLMARLVEALRPAARLVLVGDPGQLESVEAGAVLADIVRAAEASPGAAGAGDEPPVAAHVVRLRRPRRYDGASALGRVADAIAAGAADATIDTMREATSDPHSQFDWVEADDPLALHDAGGIATLVGPVVQAAANAAAAGDAPSALRALSDVRVLCAHRNGRFGVARWNTAIESWAGIAGHWPPGRAVVVTRNDPRTGLVNGDTGIVVRSASGRPLVAFRPATGDAATGDVRLFAPAQLDHLDTAFATTVHKSQGSEYAAVAVVLPPESSPLLTRELLYTAVTRSRGRLLIVGSAAAVRRAVSTPSQRMTGLADALR